MKARRWAMAVAALFMLSPATGWAQSDALLDNYNSYATFYAQGRFQEALPFARLLAEQHKAEFGAEHPTAAVLMANIAELHVELGQLSEAEPLLIKAVQIAEKSLGQGHRTAAVLVGKLAKLYRQQGRYDEAEMLYLRTIKIKEEEFGPNHMAVAVSLNDLAQLYYLESRFAEAEPLYRRALGILAEIERVHPLTSAVLFNNIAQLFAAQGRDVSAVMPRLTANLKANEAVQKPPEIAETANTEVADSEPVRVAAEQEIPPAPQPEAVTVAAAEEMPETVLPEVEYAVDEMALAELAVDETVEDVPEAVVMAAAESVEPALPDSAETTPIAEEVVVVLEPQPAPQPAPQPELEPEREAAAPASDDSVAPTPPDSTEIAPIAEEIVASLEPEPAPVPEPEREAAAPASEAELEWARIDAALDIPQEGADPAPVVQPEEEAAGMRFDLAGVIIDGSSIYSARELLPIYRRYLGKEVSVNDLYRISSAITSRYAADGYAETTAVVPTQLIRGGVVTIQIQESFLGDIMVVD